MRDFPVFDSTTTDGPTAQPHREAIESLVDPATSDETNAASANALATTLLKAEASATAVNSASSSRHDQVAKTLGDLADQCTKLEGSI